MSQSPTPLTPRNRTDEVTGTAGPVAQSALDDQAALEVDGGDLPRDEAGRSSATAEPDGGEVVKVFCAPHCPACDATVRSLIRAGVAFQKIELDSMDPEDRAEVVTGHQQAPVVQAPGIGVWSGHRPTQIERLIESHAAQAAPSDPDGPR